MEIIDLYDCKKQKLNKTMVRDDGEPGEGEFKLTVHTWVMNDKGEILIQKRNDNLKRNPGKWSFNGGAVKTGETSLEGAIRELREEIGIVADVDKLELLITFKREKGFVDVWLLKQNIDIKDIKLQEEEVSNAKWATLKEISEMLESGEFVASVELYFDLFLKLLKKCHDVGI